VALFVADFGVDAEVIREDGVFELGGVGLNGVNDLGGRARGTAGFGMLVRLCGIDAAGEVKQKYHNEWHAK
jgi:hypothetical protein